MQGDEKTKSFPLFLIKVSPQAGGLGEQVLGSKLEVGFLRHLLIGALI